MHKLAQAIEWREAVASGEMVETRDYTKHYMGYSDITSQKELDAICTAINAYYQAMNDDKRIVNYKGELIPGLRGPMVGISAYLPDGR